MDWRAIVGTIVLAIMIFMATRRWNGENTTRDVQGAQDVATALQVPDVPMLRIIS